VTFLTFKEWVTSLRRLRSSLIEVETNKELSSEAGHLRRELAPWWGRPVSAPSRHRRALGPVGDCSRRMAFPTDAAAGREFREYCPTKASGRHVRVSLPKA
jgi:hypothetical protein